LPVIYGPDFRFLADLFKIVLGRDPHYVFQTHRRFGVLIKVLITETESVRAVPLGFLPLTKLLVQDDFIELCHRYICNIFISQNFSKGIYIHTFLLTYVLTYLLHGAESLLRS
jgi:hypothetical protein